ncbi:MAG TPA: DNA repair protein RecO [Candidatus Acidoferrum sp.]|nr:DNA repair protein RecO [Candidatus Acidoferrum sp.]
MPLKESEAIVLRSFPLGEADRLVSFLSRTEGRLRGVASGARRTKNKFGSTLEVLSHIRIWFYERETRDLVRISQCELVESFYAAQGDYDRSIAFAMISEIVEAVLPEHEAADPVFRLVLLVSRAISEGKGIIAPLAYFALWSVRLAGWLPPIERCENCGKVFTSAGAYLQPSGDLVCSDCKIGGELITAQTLNLGRKILAEKLEALLQAPPPEAELKKVIQFSLDIIEREIDRKLSTRKLVTGEIEI